MLLKTALNDAHRKLGARMVDFGGWDMPVVYTNQIEEHHKVRKEAGIFDVSHMGELMVTGPDALVYLQKLVSRDVVKLNPGQVGLCVLCNETGGIIDDLTVYKFSDEKFMPVINAGTTPGDYAWFMEHVGDYNVKVENISDNITKLDLQGPNAEQILQKLTSTDLKEIARYHFKEITVDSVLMIVSRSGYTGEDGFELYFDVKYSEQIWNKLLEVGKEYGLAPCGLGARDTLRTECGMMLYGHDIDTEHSPLEAVYSWAVSLDKDFIGRDALVKQKEEGLKRKIVGFEMIDRGIARQHYPIYYQGREVGEVTSGTPSPTLNKNIGLGYVEFGLHKADTEIEIKVRDNLVKAKIVKLPFYKANSN